MRSRLLALAAIAVVSFGLLPLSAALATPDQLHTVPASRVLLMAGHAWGHGHGLSQEGARAAAAVKGRSAGQILSFYYPHTNSSSIGNPKMRIKLEGVAKGKAVIGKPKGKHARLSLHDLKSDDRMNLPTAPKKWRVTAAASDLRVWQYVSGDWQRWPDNKTAWQGPLTLATKDGSAAAPMRVLYPSDDERDYRGFLKFEQTGSDRMTTMAVMPMEDYLRGVVPRESPSSYPAAALQSQAVAARTYAQYSRTHAGSRAYDICDSTQCQVFGGSREVTPSGTVLDLEPASTNAAIEKTAGRIRAYKGNPIFSQYSASNGGWSSDGGQPYLIARRDPYDGLTHTLSHAWTARVPVSALEDRWPSLGTLRRVRVTDRDGNGDWGGRIQEVVLQGSKGSVTVTGQEVYAAYSWPTHSTGMRSNWWQILPAASDVTGNGLSDVVAGAPGRDVAGQNAAGAITIQPGAAGGVATTGGGLVSQSSGGVPGGSEKGDGFGSTATTGDFDGDGNAEVAVGSPDEDLATANKAGSVVVLNGGSGALLTQNTKGIAGGAEHGDRFGAALATGDFDGDGYADLAISAPGEGGAHTKRAGVVTVVPGSPSGLRPGDSRSFSEDSGGIPGGAESGDRFGSALAAGDLSRDGRDELVIGVPHEKAGRHPSGLVVALHGTSSGVTSAGADAVGGRGLGNIAHGKSVAVADFDRDGFADVAAGGKGATGNGAVSIIFGSKGGLTTAGARKVSQSTKGVPGRNEDGDRFGRGLAAGDTDEDGYADLLAGIPGEDLHGAKNAGAAVLLYGSGKGITGSRTRLITQNINGVKGAVAAGDEFGKRVAVMDVSGDRLADVAIAAPGNDSDRGSVNLLLGTESGVTAGGDRLLRIGTARTGATAAEQDRYGGALARE